MPTETPMNLKERMQQDFDTSAISAQVLPFNTWNEEGDYVEAQQLVVLDAQDRFMFVIGYISAPEYIFDGYVNYEKIFQDFIFTEAQWEQIKADSAALDAQQAQAEEEAMAVQEGTNVPS